MRPLDLEAVRAHPLVATLEWHDEVGSTNDRAKELVTSGVGSPALVGTDRQTAGRGRGSNRWWSADGALTFSFVIDTRAWEIAPESQGIVSLATGVATIEAVGTAASVSAQHKWPNDVFLGGKKLAGILIESPQPNHLVIGVGINANNTFEHAPDDLRATATSLADHVGSSVDPTTLMLAFLDAMEACLQLVAARPAELIEAARAACLLTGRRLTIVDGDRTVTGICRGIDDNGGLRIEVNGVTSSFIAGTIQSVDPPLGDPPHAST
ncbi:MAG: biotin--[acetyl-CoA-carboxylase] ligase [Planctomycetota bacterium]